MTALVFLEDPGPVQRNHVRARDVYAAFQDVSSRNDAWTLDYVLT